MAQISKVQAQSHAYDPVFMQDICDFFSRRKMGHVGVWRYSEPLFPGDVVNGMEHWAKFLQKAQKDGSYYVFQDEVNVIKKFCNSHASLLPNNATLVDLGPGSRDAVLQKIGPMIGTGRISSYVGVDVVEQCVERSRNLIEQNFSNMMTFGITKDFFKETFRFPVSGTPVLAMFGQTLFNLPINPHDKKLALKTLLQRLMMMRRDLGYQGYLIIAQDVCQDGETQCRAYRDEAAFAENLLHRIRRDLPTSKNFDPEQFRFSPEWVTETGALAHTYICQKDLNFSIGEENFALKQGECLYLHNTYKVRSDVFLELAKKAHFEQIHTHTSDSKRLVLHLLKAV